MMKRTYLVLCVFSLSLVVGCNDDKAKEKTLYDQVMETHDEVMPEMGALMKLTKRLKVELDSVMSSDIENQKELTIEINGLISDLESANESMMQWMRDFEPLEEGTAHGEVMQFLTEQKKKVDKVKEDMLNAKDKAEKYFAED